MRFSRCTGPCGILQPAADFHRISAIRFSSRKGECDPCICPLTSRHLAFVPRLRDETSFTLCFPYKKKRRVVQFFRRRIRLKRISLVLVTPLYI